MRRQEGGTVRGQQEEESAAQREDETAARREVRQQPVQLDDERVAQ